MIEKDDWRLTNQQDYLTGVTLYWKKYKAPSATWDHDHCEFCWQTFTEFAGSEMLREGFTTDDNYRWICKPCFDDFKEMFQWKLADAAG